MTPTNRPITSREYKLIFNTERFRDRKAGWLAEFGSTKTANVFEVL